VIATATMKRTAAVIALVVLNLGVHIDGSRTEGTKVVALEYCAPELWEACADAIIAWSRVYQPDQPGRVQIRVRYAPRHLTAILPNKTALRHVLREDNPGRYVMTVTQKKTATEEIMRLIALALGFGAGPPPFDWIDREFPGVGVFIANKDHFSEQITGRIMSKRLVPGARLSASTVEAVRRAQGGWSPVCVDNGDCNQGFQCRPTNAHPALPDECIRAASEGISVTAIALIAVWSGIAALIVVL